MKVRIIIRNDANIELFNEIITAENENKAIKQVLETEIIYAGDKIETEEV